MDEKPRDSGASVLNKQRQVYSQGLKTKNCNNCFEFFVKETVISFIYFLQDYV